MRTCDDCRWKVERNDCPWNFDYDDNSPWAEDCDDFRNVRFPEDAFRKDDGYRKDFKTALNTINDAILEINHGDIHSEDFYWWKAVLETFQCDLDEKGNIVFSERSDCMVDQVRPEAEIKEKGGIGAGDRTYYSIAYYCPRCGKSIPRGYASENACNSCGTFYDWGKREPRIKVIREIEW